MQPENQKNYWQPSPDDEREIDSAPDTQAYEQPTDEPVNISTDVSVEQDEAQTVKTVSKDEPIHWTALEHIPHERNAAWFVGFAVVALLLMALAIFLVRSVTFSMVIAVAAASIIVYTRRPPREIAYTLSQKGLYVGDRLYDLKEYKAFGVIKDGYEYSIMLIPTKRFLPGLVVYFPQESGEQIVDLLGQRLPMQKLELDFVDRIVRKLRL